MKYLPPINAKVTDFNTIYSHLTYMQTLAEEANMPYVNLTLDVGAAINAYKVIWSYPDLFKNVMIHLGDFHFIKENFGVIGKLIAGSGFEDVIFQSNVCASGSLEGVLAGSHYNRCWIVYSPFYEALERLLFMRFIDDHHIQLPEDFKQTENVDFSIHNIIEKHNDLLAKYFQFKDEVRSGILGKTAQFWVMNFMDLMEIQFRAHLAVQENDYVLRHQAWKAYLPYYCSTNKVNYQRYGGFYVATLENIDNLYPGNKELLSRNGFSVQFQNKYLLRTAVDQRGEQTLNPDAKVAGGIKNDWK